METLDDELLIVEIEPVLSVRMKGMGYGHPEWGHGFWKGDLAIAGEAWNLDDVDPERYYGRGMVAVERP